MYEVDFLPVENDNQDGGKSGDAITIRFTATSTRRDTVVVIDGGRGYTSDTLATHIEDHYHTDHVDLMISTHPDADHLDGLAGAIDLLDVDELLIHQPGLHRRDIRDFSNRESLEKLLSTARARRVALTEPFTGLSRFGGRLTVLGPTLTYYEDLLDRQLAEARSATLSASAREPVRHQGHNLLEHRMPYLPAETLTDDGQTGPRNNSSVITLLTAGDDRLLFTGDAGIPALEAAALEYESRYGSLRSRPLTLLQAPHHGSHHNLGPAVLDRLIGSPSMPHAGRRTAMISSAKASPKHPSPKVVNALIRRGCDVIATEGRAICSRSADAPPRQGWVPLAPLRPLVETGD